MSDKRTTSRMRLLSSSVTLPTEISLSSEDWLLSRCSLKFASHSVMRSTCAERQDGKRYEQQCTNGNLVLGERLALGEVAKKQQRTSRPLTPAYRMGTWTSLYGGEFRSTAQARNAQSQRLVL